MDRDSRLRLILSELPIVQRKIGLSMLKLVNINPTWILSSQRTGSGYLCSVLGNATGALWREVFSARSIVKSDFRDKSGNIQFLPKYAKIHAFQFFDFFKKKDYESIFNILPSLKLIRLKRRDLIAQTVSLYISQETNKYTKFSNTNYINIKINIEEKKLLKIYMKNINQEKEWKKFTKIADHFVFFYEDLFGEKMIDLFKYLDIEVGLVSKAISHTTNKKTNHPQTEELKAVLCSILGGARGQTFTT
jgi:LPS sulfotransferase NodH